MTLRAVSLVCLVLMTAACAGGTSSQPSTGERAVRTTEAAVEATEAGLGKAVSTPLSDLNLQREEIPPLLEAIRTPYAPVGSTECQTIAVEVAALDAVLGRDWDAPAPVDQSLDEQVADGASTAVLDAVASGASGFIPYRGIVRSLSGASAHQKKVLRAYERGTHRRTFLKGVGLALACPPPASPLPVVEDEPKVEFR